MSQQLKVGQVWKDRAGNEVTIVPDVGRDNVKHGSVETFPFRGSNDKSYTTRGTFWTYDESYTTRGTFWTYEESDHDLIELIRDVPDSDGWITWNGGECPVSGDTVVETRFWDDSTDITEAGNLRWSHINSIGDIVAYRVVKQPAKPEQPTTNPKHAHYFKSVAHLDTVDVYRVCELFGVTDQAIGHAIKKLLCAGQRGVKDQRKDVQEAIDTLTRRVAMWQEDEVAK